MEKENWKEKAECASMDTKLFFPGLNDKKSAKIALEACGKCPVRQECLASNIEEAIGIFGGTNARQRRMIRVSDAIILSKECCECGKVFPNPIKKTICSEKCRSKRRLRQKRQSQTRSQSQATIQYQSGQKVASG